MNIEKKTAEVNNPQRRQMMKAAAWAAPVVAVAASAPLAAASITTVQPGGSVAFGYDVGAGSVTAESATFSATFGGTAGATTLSTGALTVTLRFPAVYSQVSVIDGQDLGNGWVVTSLSTDGSGRKNVTAQFAPGISSSTPGTLTVPSFTTPIVASGAPSGTVPSAESIRVKTEWANNSNWGTTTFWPNEND